MYKILDDSDNMELLEFINKIHFSNETEKTAWARAHSKLGNSPECVISAEIQEGSISAACLSYSINWAWFRTDKVVPYWCVGAYRNLNSTISVRHRTESVMAPVLNHFESLGYKTFFMARMVSRAFTSRPMESIIRTIGDRTFGIDTYRCSLEESFYDNFDYATLSLMYKAFTFNHCPDDKSILILRYDKIPAPNLDSINRVNKRGTLCMH